MKRQSGILSSVIGLAISILLSAYLLPISLVFGAATNLPSVTAATDIEVRDRTINPLANVLCHGPDGREFRTSYRDCATFNKAWNKTTFSYRPIPGVPVTRTEASLPQTSPTGVSKSTPLVLKKEIQSDDAKVQITAEGDVLHLKTIKTDGREAEVDTILIDHINELLAFDDIQIQKAESSGVTIRQGTTSVTTTLPVSVDMNTHNLAVFTTEGEKSLSVLPDRALRSLISKRSVTALDQSHSAHLIMLPDKVVAFTLPVLKSKKLAGFIPIDIHKNMTVSAETGEILSVSQPFIDRVIDWSSF